jgi:hypothetical protein
MKRWCIVLAALFCAATLVCPFSAAAEGPDGFANVPWGANRSQLDRIMAQQGFKSTGQRGGEAGSTIYRYYGTLAGVSGYANFSFLNDTFFRGSFGLNNEDGGGAEAKAYSQFFPIIQAKYGSPSKSGDQGGAYTGSSHVWEGLKAPGSGDTIQLILTYAATTERCGRGYCTSSFLVDYLNQSLQQRLAGQRKDGL